LGSPAALPMPRRQQWSKSALTASTSWVRAQRTAILKASRLGGAGGSVTAPDERRPGGNAIAVSGMSRWNADKGLTHRAAVYTLGQLRDGVYRTNLRSIMRYHDARSLRTKWEYSLSTHRCGVMKQAERPKSITPMTIHMGDHTICCLYRRGCLRGMCYTVAVRSDHLDHRISCRPCMFIIDLGPFWHKGDLGGPPPTDLVSFASNPYISAKITCSVR
jgi:hypothetical protein